jgi:hypothetical protein
MVYNITMNINEVITTVGGAYRLGKLLGIDPSIIYRWQRGNAKLETSGYIPIEYWERITKLLPSVTINDLYTQYKEARLDPLMDKNAI